MSMAEHSDAFHFHPSYTALSLEVGKLCALVVVCLSHAYRMMMTMAIFGCSAVWLIFLLLSVSLGDMNDCCVYKCL